MNPTLAIAGEASNRVRAAKSQVKRQVRSGELTLPQVMADPPPELRQDLLTKVIELAPMWGKARLEALGRQATRDGVNLLVTLGRATPEVRRWVAEHLDPGGMDGLCGLTFEQRVAIKAGGDGAVAAADAVIAIVREHRRMVASTEADPDLFGKADGWLWEQAEQVARELAA